MLAVVKEGEGRLQEPSALIAVCPHHALFAAIAIGNQRERKGKTAWRIRQNDVGDKVKWRGGEGKKQASCPSFTRARII